MYTFCSTEHILKLNNILSYTIHTVHKTAHTLIHIKERLEQNLHKKLGKIKKSNNGLKLGSTEQS